MENPFHRENVGQRYARARPYFHPEAIRVLSELLRKNGLPTRYSTALDIGCGTGLSSVALTAIAERVLGIDPSGEMLEHAMPHQQVRYEKRAAEEVSAHFELTTMSQSSHWVDHETVFPKLSGLVAVYDCFVTGQLVEYLKNYPPPSRRFLTLPQWKELPQFTFIDTAEFTCSFEWKETQLVDFLCTQSNVIHFQKESGLSWPELEERLKNETRGMFDGKTLRLPFAGFVHLLKAN